MAFGEILFEDWECSSSSEFCCAKETEIAVLKLGVKTKQDISTVRKEQIKKNMNFFKRAAVIYIRNTKSLLKRI